MANIFLLISLLGALYVLFLILKLGVLSLKALVALGRGVVVKLDPDVGDELVIRRSDLWSIEGKIGRGPYVIIGFMLVAIKFNLDRYLSLSFTGNFWKFFGYFNPSNAPTFSALSPTEIKFFAVMILISLPFIWSGVALTVRRLRDLDTSPYLALLFFVPGVNLLMFLLLALIPSRGAVSQISKESTWKRVVPRSKAGSALFSVLLSVPLGLALFLSSAYVFKSYGWGLFLGLPFTLGMVSSHIFSVHERRTLRECVEVSALTVVLISLALVAFLFEGLICIAMAAPLGVVLTVLGAIAYWYISGSASAQRRNALVCSVLFLAPAADWIEGGARSELEAKPVVTSIVIERPAKDIWPNIISFPELRTPAEWVFQTGIAYPIRARIEGSGVGAIRHCEFTTGSFIEPIEVWNEPNLLKFSVQSQPPIMDELNPFGPVHPPHVEDYLVSKGGEFKLTEVSDGITRVEATTWYSHKIFPEAYWRVWSDFIIHRIHLRVLEHVKALSLANPPARSSFKP